MHSLVCFFRKPGASVLLPLLLLALAGCAGSPVADSEWPPVTQYHAPVAESRTGSPLTVEELARRLTTSDVIIVGEYHGHHGSHLLQSRLQQALFRLNPAQILSLEPFNADHQSAVDAYLAGETGEGELIEDGAAWPGYRAFYRPLMEFARHHQLMAVAANAPARIVRCLGRKGESWLDDLDPEQSKLLPEDPFFSTSAYRERFFEVMGEGHGEGAAERRENSFKAQLLRDNTMASRILAALRQHPGHQVLHINGTFHSEQQGGVTASLLHRAPELKVAVITPVFVTHEETTSALATLVHQHAHKGDYLYFLQALPDEFRDPERYRAHIRSQFRAAASHHCGQE